MSELTYSIFVFALMLIGIAGLVWANIGFDRMTELLGPLGRWGMLIGSTRFGMSLAMIGTVILGLAALPPRLLFYPESWREALLIAFLAITGTGFFHDVLAPAEKSGDGR